MPGHSLKHIIRQRTNPDWPGSIPPGNRAKALQDESGQQLQVASEMPL